MSAKNQNFILTSEELSEQVLSLTGRLYQIENLLRPLAQANPQQTNSPQPIQPQAVTAPYLISPLAAPVVAPVYAGFYQAPVGIPVVFPVVVQQTPQQVYDYVFRVFGQALSDYLNQNPNLRRLIP
jgi:hypothetical protein